MSALSKMSLRPNGTPLSSVFFPDLSRSRAWANAASPARWLHARTTGSRSAIRARQLATTASAVSSPCSIRRTRVVAARRFGSAFGMAVSPGPLSPAIYAHPHGRAHGPIYPRRLRLDSLLLRGGGFRLRCEQIPAAGRLRENALQVLRQQVASVDQVQRRAAYLVEVGGPAGITCGDRPPRVTPRCALALGGWERDR